MAARKKCRVVFLFQLELWSCTVNLQTLAVSHELASCLSLCKWRWWFILFEPLSCFLKWVPQKLQKGENMCCYLFQQFSQNCQMINFTVNANINCPGVTHGELHDKERPKRRRQNSLHPSHFSSQQLFLVLSSVQAKLSSGQCAAPAAGSLRKSMGPSR